MAMVSSDLKILHVSRNRESGGRSVFTVDLILELENLGIKNLFLCDNKGDLHNLARIRRLNYKVIKKLRVSTILKYALRNNARIIVFHDAGSYRYIPGVKKQRKKGLKTIAFVHRYDYEKIRFPEQDRLLKASRLIVSSRRDKNRLRDIPVNMEKVIILHKPVLMKRFNHRASPQPILQSFRIPPEISLITTVARIDDSLNYNLWLDTIEYCIKNYDDVEFLVVGAGKRLEEFKKRAKARSLNHKILFTGFHTDIPHIMAASDIYFHPVYQDEISFSLIEALAVGKPIVAPSLSSIRDVLKNGRNGLLYRIEEPDAAFQLITRLREDLQLQIDINRNNVRDAVEKYSLTHVAEKFVKICGELLDIE